MTTRVLRLAKDLTLPLDFATKTAAILAQRRKGKTYTASVIAEEMVAAKQPFVALDPTGAWWGLRAAADGKGEGLPVVVLGGQHGDVPLERTGGRLIADLVVEEPGYYVIDFSLFESGEAERQFAVDFAERLYRAKGQPGRDFPLHLFVDEADRFIPQQMRKGSSETSPRLLGAFEAIVRRGGLRGLGTTLISQRAAVVNKNVLEMLDILFALRTVGPNDRQAIENYIEAHGSDAERKVMMDSLASLEIGEAWVWEPGAEPPLFQRVRIRARHTFNSSATPKPGEKRVEPKRLADVDLQALQKRMAATIEKAKQDDPRELRKQIADLKRQVEQQGKQSVETTPIRQVEDRPVLTEADRALLEKVGAQFAEAGRLLSVNTAFDIDDLLNAFRRELERFKADVSTELTDRRADFLAVLERKGFAKILEKLAAVQPAAAAQPRLQARPAPPIRGRHQGSAPPDRGSKAAALPLNGGSDNGRLPPGEFATLTAALQYPDGLDRKRLGILTGYKRSSRDAYIARLQQKGLVTVNGTMLYPTDAGRDALNGSFEPLPTGTALVEYWRARLPEGERKTLDVLLDANGEDVDRERIDEATEYKRSSRDAYLVRLKARGLVEFSGRGTVRASAELFN